MFLARSPVGKFLASGAGRLTRIVAGLALILLGIVVIQGAAGWAVAAVGLIPLLAGIFDVCVISALAGGPFHGADIRSL
jgi:hypothetical protein